ncbi:Hypothetical Protein RSKD131_4080 [Cereibacter sphaeroides KD131]|nr:Hypothetical Protein RSKD131_4080 [Cereibacter sphaeroides KD131]
MTGTPMTLDDLKARHSALLAARYSGTRSVSYDGKSINYGSDAELAAAIGDIERRIAALERTGRRVLRPFAVKDL